MDHALTNHLPGNTFHAAAAPRFDMYTGIHKALRAFMVDTLLRLGRVDVEDADELGATLAQLDALLAELRHHLHNENDFVHTAIEARRPAGASRTAADHVEHQASIADLEDEVRTLRAADPARRALLALRLYRHLALFVAENLEHMQIEETANQATLWALYTDAELAAVHDAILANHTPEQMATVVRWMARALSPQELTGLCLDARAKLPPEAFAGLFGLIRAELAPARSTRLARALDVAPVPGLVEA